MTLSRRLPPLALIAAVVLVACSGTSEEAAPRVVQPGAPGEPNRELTAGELADLEVPQHTDADVRFMRAMIPHHLQALRMTSLVPARSEREDIPLLAGRMDAAQAEEIAFMQRWLEDRGEEVPDQGSGHEHDGASDSGELMPGMLTEGELTQLQEATGAEFDRLFLEFMIGHHEGALVMVEELLSSDGGQEPEIFQLASHIDSDQRIEIGRMHGILAELDGDAPD
ncbi:MAG: DUF305 domain-containing protein [Nitriliruptorales bacterium]|nr:DUF305 domain-containing protein [Nitriliruptorales bacterium]